MDYFQRPLNLPHAGKISMRIESHLQRVIRNLFECLSLGEEGMRISLRAGEDPNSAMRMT